MNTNYDEPIVVTPQPTASLPPGACWQPRIGDEAQGLIDRKLPGPEGKAVLAAAASILGCGVSPGQSNGQVAGLVVGYIQSGKTLSFTTVAALARDNGFQLVIVIAGTSTPLLKQSTQRLHKDLLIEETEGSLKWRPYINPIDDENTRRYIRQSLEEWQDLLVPEEERATILITVMKNYRHLAKLNTLLQYLHLESVPTLIIDDEADQASLNTLISRKKQSTTYQCISELRSAVQSHTFLQYTATPQAPLLINIIDELSPHFVEVIDPGEDYVGGEDFFSSTYALTRVIPHRDILSDEPPMSLLEALRVFLVGVAAGLVEGRSAQNMRRSMLVHPSQKTAPHQKFRNWIGRVFDDWQRLLGLSETDTDRIELMCDFLDAYNDLAQTADALPPFDDIARMLTRAFRNTSIEEINATSGRTPAVKWGRAYGWILVGGQAMDRGFTVEGLTVTYMPRSTGVGNADTIQQRARFFGYKRAYLGFCRIYLEQDVLTAFQQYVAHEEEMRQSLQGFSASGRPLREWKRAFILSSDLKPCRNNVIQYKYVRGNYSNQWFLIETINSPGEVADENRRIISETTDSLDFFPDTSFASSQIAQKHLVCKSASLRNLLSTLLVPYRTSSAKDAQNMTGLLMQLSDSLERNPSETAFVYQMRPEASSERSVDNNGRVNQVFQGPTRVRGSSNQQYSYPGDRDFRDEDRVSVQLHCFNLRNDRDQLVARNMPVIAVWVPKRMRLDWLVQNQPI